MGHTAIQSQRTNPEAMGKAHTDVLPLESSIPLCAIFIAMALHQLLFCGSLEQYPQKVPYT